MEDQISSKKIILNNGAILGVIAIVISLIVYALGMSLQQPWQQSVVSLLATIVVIVIGIKQFKELNGGFISWGQSVKIGVGIALISSLISVIYTQIFVNFIEPEFMSQLLEVQKQQWVDQGYNDQQLESAESMYGLFSGPAISSAVGLIGGAIFGFIISAIAGAIMKKSEEDLY